jgi:methyl-accepting chemotaxis protein
MRLRDLSLSKKLFSVLGILMIPTAMLLYFLIVENDSLIRFASDEIAGVTYLRALQQAHHSALVEQSSGAIMALERAESADGGALRLTDKTKAAVAALKSGNYDEAVSVLTDAIGLASDNSNITLDPEAETYFVGDILVNQAESILKRSNDLVGVARELQKGATEQRNIDFAVARDGLNGAVASFAADWSKAVQADKDFIRGTVLNEMGEKLLKLTAGLTEAAKNGRADQVLTLAPETEAAFITFLPKIDDAMTDMLTARIAGFRLTVMWRLAAALIVTVLGLIGATLLIRSISRPLSEIVGVLDAIRRDPEAAAIPQADRNDEIGQLIHAAERYRDTAVAALATERQDRARREREARDHAQTRDVNSAFTSQVHSAIGGLSGNLKTADASVAQIARETEAAVHQANLIGGAARQASENVRSVARAVDLLSSSIDEIAATSHQASAIAAEASRESAQAQDLVRGLSEAADKIDAVMQLINSIAAQTNLLALNATIEAARAGEAGKGFAVVAAEVKTLADQTGRATKDIVDHVGAVQAAVGQVSQVIEGIGGTIERVNAVSATIAGSVQRQSAATDEIGRNVQLTARSADQVTESITHVLAATEKSCSVSTQVRACIADLEREAAELHENIEIYVRQTAA